MKLRSTLALVLALIIIVVLIPLWFLGYIPLPNEVLGNGNGDWHYLTVRTDPTGIVEIPGEGWYRDCTNVSLTAPGLVDVSEGTRYRFEYWDVDGKSKETGKNTIHVIMSCDHTATAHYTIQYYLTMFTNYGTVTPGDGWHDAGAEVTIDAFPPEADPGERYVWNGWTGIGEVSYTGDAKTASIIMNNPINETASWIHQHYLTVISPYGTVGGEGWYDAGETAYATLDTDMVDHGNGTRRVFISWTGDASGSNYAQSNLIIMDASKTAIADWQTQYLLTVTAGSGGTANPIGSEWYNTGSVVSVTAIPNIYYIFDYWEFDGTPIGSDNPHAVLMDTAHTLHATFVYSPPPAYYLTVRTNPPNVVSIPGEGWYDEGQIASLTAPTTVSFSTDARYRFDHWDVDGISQGPTVNHITLEMNGNHTATAHYSPQYYLTVRTNPDGITAIPGEGWYDESTDVPLRAPPVQSYAFLYWDVDGDVRSGSSIIVNMNIPHIATAFYEPRPPVVGGITVSVESPMHHAWMALNALILAAFFSVRTVMKRKQR